MKRLTALMLCIATILSMFAQGFAADGDGGATDTPSVTDTDGYLTNATDPATGRPRLYVDFLGDNAGHNSAGTNTPAIGSTVRVENRDFSLETNGAGFANGWDKYTDAATYWADANGDGSIGAGETGTVFYIGVGIDRTNLLKMLEEIEQDDGLGNVTKSGNKGVYSFEAGFYYNPQFVEPYVANGDYAATIENANLTGGAMTSNGINARWDASNYRVLEAYTGLDPQMDGGLNSAGAWGELTQEVLASPSNMQISNAANGWKMTYVSVEMKADRIAEAARLAGYYDGEFHPIDDTDTEKNRETEYLLVIPFVLKAYDSRNDLCFRLVRNATHFTMGAASDGAINRAAWERVTTRNEPYNLKLQTMFTGDLNIFTGKKMPELENRYKATLVMDGGGTKQNTAEVAINGDPAVNYARITKDGEELTGLAGGTGMHIETHVAPRYSVTVKAYPAADPTKTNLITFGEVVSTKGSGYREFEFIMPEEDVIVEIIFTLDPNAPKDYAVLLDERDREGTDDMTDGSPVGRPERDLGDKYIEGNYTHIEGRISAVAAPSEYARPEEKHEVDSYDGPYDEGEPPDDITYKYYPVYDLCGIEATAAEPTWSNPIEIHTDLHGDYMAEIRFYTADDVSFAPDAYPAGAQLRTDTLPDGSVEYVLVLQEGGDYRFAMRASDVVVRVDYLLATQHEANMVIRHLDKNGELDNITRELERAQLSFVGYRDDNIGEMRYGSVWRDAGVNISTDTSVDPAVTTRTDILPDILAADQTNILPIPATASTYSGSLAGDRAPKPLDEIMRAAALCTKGTITADDYTPITDEFTTGDLMALGLRKDTTGAHYLTDADLTAFAAAALELTEFLKADATKYAAFLGTYTREVPDPANPGTNKTETVTYAKLSANAAEAVELMRAWLAASDTEKAIFKDRIAKLPGPDPNYTIFSWAHDYLYSEAPFDHDDDRYGEDNPTGTPRVRGIAVTNGWTDVADKQPMQAREGRVMRVTATAGSEYTVQRVVIREKNPAAGTTARSFEATRDTRYANVYTFEMPAYDVDVEVYYVLRTVPKLTLVTEPATLPSGAAVRMTAYTPSDPPSVYATPVTKTQNGDVIPNALSGSTVRVFIDEIPDDYSVRVRVTDAAGTTVQTRLLGGGVQIREGSVVTFVMPTTDTTVTVTFEPINDDEHRAYISVVGRPAGLDITGSSGVFQNGYSVITLPTGSGLTGTVVVPKGYYIYSVTAIGRSGSYPFEQSGNGWDNDRAASLNVTILSEMPDEDLYITVQLAEGPPPEEPLLPVTLLVSDEGNVGTNDPANSGKKIFDDNHAVMSLYDPANPPTPAPATRDSVVGYDLGLVASTVGIVDQDTEYVESGSMIYVDVVCHTGYYISATVVTPTRHNIEVEWVSESRFRFATPDSACAVTVEYTKKTESDDGNNFHLTVNKTESPSPDTSAANALTGLTIGGAAPTDPATIAYGTTYTTGGRLAVEAEIAVDAGWYVRSVRLVQNGSTRWLTLGAGNKINFIMPPAETELIVDYRHGGPNDDAGKFDLRLEVYDPDNTNQSTPPAPPVYDDNSATATIAHRNSSPDSTLGAFGRNEGAMSGVTTVVSGDTVTLEWETASGYALEAIAITAGGSRISPRYVYTPPVYDTDGTTVLTPAKTTASFDMPAADTTVRVRFVKGDEHLYRADIVIYGADGNLDNRASFADTLGGNVNDDIYNRSGLHGGEYMPVYIVAADGYYIESVTVRPSSTGVTTTLSGSFGPQFVSFNMPAADVQVNVKFAKAWPDEAKFGVYLSVIDPMADVDNWSHKLAGAIEVRGGERKWIDALVDGAIENVHIHRDAHARVKSVTVVDSAGHPVPWWWSGSYSSTVSFEMPPLAVDVIVEYELVTDWSQYENNVTLHTTARPGASGSSEMMIVEDAPDATPPTLAQKPGTTTVTQNGTISAVREGELVQFTATPDTGSVVVAAYAVSSGRILDLYSRNAGAAPLIPDGGSATFAMPNANADVYVVFDKATNKATDRYATLYVSGPYISSSAVSGRAELFERWDASNTTGTITPNNHSGSIVLGIGSRARVRFKPSDGYSVASFKILDSAGNRVDYTMRAQADGSLLDADGYMTAEYIQPESGSRAYVEFERIDTSRKYTARVVVDNGGSTDNTAAIDQLPRDAWVKLIQDAKPGEQIDIDINCATGYEFSIIILPQHRGIQAPLQLPNNKSQQSAFIMPADDVVVFVKFVTDSRTRYTAALSVSGGSSAVTSTIRSDFNTVPLVSYSGGSAQIVRATPDEEKVYVNTRRAENLALGYSVESIIVETTAGDPVPYTLDAAGNLSFPMVASNVNISVKFKSGDPPRYDLTLHVGNDGVANGVASLTEQGTSPANTTGSISGAIAGFNTKTIEVEAGRTVDLSAAAQDIGTYGIYYAYVVYGDTSPYAGQFIPFGRYDRTMATTNTSILRSLAADFVMQPYDVDVYVFFADDADFPPAGTVLWLSVVGPDGSGSATLTTDYCDPPTSASPLTVNAGDADAFLPASPRSYASIDLNIATGYTIESIVITPLGSDADGRLIGGNLYTLTMPEHTIKVRITLKKSDTTDFVATLHVSNIDRDGKTLSSPNRAEIGWPIAKTNWTDSVTSTDAGRQSPHDSSVTLGNDQIIVPERQVVDLYSYVNSTGYYLLSAYVLSADGRMVPLSGDPIDGTAYDPAIANNVANAQTSFEMPANDVDVYVVYTNLPSPPPGWRTTALVATEAAANGDITNGGHNTASITEAAAGSFFYEYVYENNVLVAINTLDPTRLTPHKATVPSFGNSWHKAYAVVEGRGVYVAEETLGEGYAFSPPVTMSASGGVPPAATLISSDPYRYNYTTLDYSSAARMHFIEGNLTAGDLRVEIVDRQNPGNLIVRNRVDVYTPSKPTLGLVSSDSAGAWQIIRSVEPSSQVTAIVTPYEGYATTAVLINKDGDETAVELERQTDGSYTGEFIMPGGGATFRVIFTRGYNAELRVINRSSRSVSATLSSPDGRTAGDRQSIGGLLGGEEMTIAASGATVQSVVYSGRTTFGHAISPLESSDWQFTMPAEDTVVTVIFGDADSTEHTAIIRVDEASDTGWRDNCSIDGIRNDTRPGAVGGTNWTTGVQGEAITGMFSTKNGWYASAYAIVRDPDGTLGELVRPVYVAQSGTSGAGLLAGLTMPNANVEIFVRFTHTDPTPNDSYDLSLEIQGAGGLAGNSATAVGGGANLSVNGASAVDGPDRVAAGTLINVGVNRTGDYRLISAEVEVTYTAPNVESGWNLTHRLTIPMTTTGSSSSGSFYMPFINEAIRGTTGATGLSAKVKVTLKFGYDATLVLYDGVGGSSATMTAGGKSVSVSTNGGRDTITGLGRTDATSTTVTSSGAVSVVGRNATDGSTVLSAAGGAYGYTMNGDSEIIVVTSNNTPTDRRYIAAVRLINADAGDWAYITDTTSAGMPSGDIWTAAKSSDRVRLEVVVGSGRSARVTANGGVTLLPQAIGADETYLFDMPANDVQITVEFFDENHPTISFGVIDRTGIAGSTASMSYAGGTIVSHTSTGSEGGIVGSYAGNFGTLNVDATPINANVAVKKIIVEGRAGGVLDITASRTFNQNAFTNGATVWVIFDKPETVTPPPPDYSPYITYIEVDPASDAGWAAAGNSIGLVLNTTDPTADGGAHWREGAQGDNMRGLFTTADGWFARVTAYRLDNNSELLAMQQNTSGGGTGSITQPSSDAKIVVLFSRDERIVNNDSQLTLAIVGHGMTRGNFAEVEFPDGVMTSVDGGDAPSTDRFTTVVSGSVRAGTQIPLDATWASGYTIAKIEVSLDSNGSIYSVPWNEYASMAAANFYMPNAQATITVYYSLEFTATLHLQNSGVVGGGAEMYDNAVPGTRVNTHLGKLEGLGGGEDIVTEPSVPSGGRLVGVFYETVKTGSHSTIPTTPNARYDFDMPQEDADVYVVYEPEDEPIKSYIARVEKYGETDVAGNEATILNTSRDVFHTTWSTMAKQGDLIQITVNLARGYQARVIGVEPGALYVTRTAFRTDGTTTTFTMPANSDAVVKIEFIEGYTATLILDDSSTHANLAHMTDDSLPNVSTTSVPDGKTYIEADSPVASSAALEITHYEKYVGAGGTTSQVTDPPVNGIEKLGVDDTLDGDVVLSDGSKLYRLIETTPTGGTRNYGERKLYKDGTNALPILGAGTVDWGMSALGSDPVEDVLITAVVLDKDDPSLIAKVQLEGDSDINGNGADIENTLPTTAAGVPASAWMKGDVWTSAVSSTESTPDTIATTVHLAPGYTATVIAINDELYYTALATLMAGGTLTRAAMTMDEMIAAAREYARIDVTHIGATALEATVTDDSGVNGVVTANMPKENAGGGSYTTGSWSDITFIVKFSAESGPRPYDPLSAEYRTGLAAEDEPILEKGWIYGVNHGDYATITVPTLNTGATDPDSGKDILQDVYRAADAENGVAGFSNDFRIYVQTDAGFVELDNSTEIRLYEVEPRVDTSYMYNSGNYYTGVGEYVADTQDARGMIEDTDYAYAGAKFNVELRELAEGATPSAAYLAFKEILETDSYDAVIGTRLKIRAVGQNGSISEATQLVLPPAYALAGTLVSYAPQHEATLELYEYDTAASDYETEPIATNYLSQDYGIGLWRQDFRVMSSELAGRDRSSVFADLDLLRGVPGATGFTTPNGHETYRLVISKAAALTYTRDGIQLRIENGKAALTATDAGLLDGDRTWVLARSSKPTVSGGGASGSVLEAGVDVSATEPTAPEQTESIEPTEPGTVEDSTALPTEETSGDALEAVGESDTVESEQPDETAVDEPTEAEPLPTEDELLPTEDEQVDDEPLPTGDETLSDTVGGVEPYADAQIARDMVILMTGDLNGDGKIKQIDYSILYAYYSRQYRWTRAEEGEVGWENSTKNPDSLAYWCDLNGDTRIDTLDLAIITDSYNYNRSTSDYGSPTGLVRAWDDSYDTTLESYINDVQATAPTSLSEFMFSSFAEPVSGAAVEDEDVVDEPAADEPSAEEPSADETSTEDELPVEDEIPVEDEPSEGEPVVELPSVETPDEFILPPPALPDENEDAELPNRREDDENDEKE